MALPRNLLAKIYEIKAHDGKVTSLDLGETGRVLVTGGDDRNVNLWAIGQDECFMSLTGHNRPIECVRFAYKDNFVYSADDIGIIRRWDLNAQTICSTLNGHMKNVRTLDFNPSGDYVVSGSNDTTVRLWDVQNDNRCIKVCRGHISHVNSVKFSPDGLWIASAGLEGSIIIWDIRKSKQIMEFIEDPPVAAITCIQFHPFEFLLAAGRVNGTVCIYDLEHQQLISKTDNSSQFYNQPIKCITFSENGECLFVGTSSGISVIGWEPDREFDNVKSAWSSLGDMKIVSNKLICGCHDIDTVSINTINLDRVIPFYQPSNSQPQFKHNSTNRKSFSRGNQKFRLSLGGSKPAQVLEDDEDSKSQILDELSSPSLSLEVVSESAMEPSSLHPYNPNLDALPKLSIYNSRTQDSSISTSTNVNNYNNYESTLTAAAAAADRLVPSGPNSLHGSDDYSPLSLQQQQQQATHSDECNLNESNPLILNNYDNLEMAEHFPVNQNFAIGPYGGPTSVPSSATASTTTNSGGGSSINASAKNVKKSNVSNAYRRNTAAISSSSSSSRTTGSSGFFGSNKISQISSVSSMELHKLDDNIVLKKSASSNVVNKNKRVMVTNNQYKENTQQQQHHHHHHPHQHHKPAAKPPMRSHTSLDMRLSAQHQTKTTHEKQTHVSNHTINYRPDVIPTSGINMNRVIMEDHYGLEMLSSSHQTILQELSNRQANLDLLRLSTRSNDVVGALKQAKSCGRSVFIDLLGAIIEKPSSWNLDLCLCVLPEIYELLQSQHKFHYTRACDTLRIILTNFMPIIKENLDAWGANGLGVDVSREDRQRKCAQCHRWLLQIKNLPESIHFGSTLTQLQNNILL